MEISADQLLVIIGRKQVEIEILQARIAQLEQQAKERAEAEVT